MPPMTAATSAPRARSWALCRPSRPITDGVSPSRAIRYSASTTGATPSSVLVSWRKKSRVGRPGARGAVEGRGLLAERFGGGERADQLDEGVEATAAERDGEHRDDLPPE